MSELNTQVQTPTTPKILLEFFVFGTEDKKKQVKKLNEELQKQMDSHRKTRNRCRVLWYMDKGEKTPEEKKEWFMENAKCKYYIFANDGETFHVSNDFVVKTLEKVKKIEDAIVSLKKAGIMVHKAPTPKIEFTKFEILE